MSEVTSSAHLQKAEQATRLAWLMVIDGRNDAEARRMALDAARHLIEFAAWKGKL